MNTKLSELYKDKSPKNLYTRNVKFAINYSHEAAELLQEGLIEFDYFKSNEWPEIISPAKALKPIYIHYPNNVGNKSEPDWQMIENTLQLSESKLINVHIIATSDVYPHIHIESTDRYDIEEVTENIVRDLQKFVTYFGADTIIAENLPYWQPARPDEIKILRIAVDPTVIRNVIEETNIGLLYDIDHARGACHYGNWTLEEYTNALPMDTLKELHMTGTRMHNGWLEAHLEMRPEDWQICQWALENIKNGTWAMPAIFANEYGGIGEHFAWRTNKEHIAQQVPRFIELLEYNSLR